MSDKHTPGPWEVGHDEGDGSHVVSYQCRDICRVEKYYDDGLANARLIAAAPEMLKALRSVRTLFRPKTGLPINAEASFRRIVQNDPVLKEVNDVLATIESQSRKGEQ